MAKEDKAILFVWIIVLVLVSAAAVAAIKFVSWLGNQPQVLAAIVSASALILGGILTHYFTQRREERNEQQRALRENYKSILSRIDNLIRGSKADDAFSNIHLETWVVGSRDVIEGTKRLIAALRLSSRTDADIEMKSLQIRTELESLVAAMRRDVGLDRIDGITLENIYELKDATGITTPRSASATAV